ncbi:hypothetical protein [Halpernia frigidisoli]|uniref:Outer membrane protein beta-barrel domain-containing protein n=1 Tax=Halpernia frigidisoli TaxID=1125876 RepID=A0A1I3J5U2_9FLAO|nr:hypothetical protein [Halpernia frigidisoli]SFI55476.1 hypothetical protein SAMN05443292_2943 [Halpernia frigidisoli]
MKLLKPLALLVTILTISINAQSTRPDKLYSSNGFGLSIPVGKTSDYFSPKFSTTLGLNIGLGNGGLFLYPKLSLHAYQFNQIFADQGYTYKVQKGRSTTYLLNVALGYRKIVNKWAFYGFAGGGGGVILTPQAAVNPTTLEVTMNNKSNSMGIAEGGAGIEYNLGAINIFSEISYQHGFSNVQNEKFNSVPISIGIKPNLSKLFKKK